MGRKSTFMSFSNRVCLVACPRMIPVMKRFVWRPNRWEGKVVNLNYRSLSLTQNEIQNLHTVLFQESELNSQKESNGEQCFVDDSVNLKNEMQNNSEEYTKDVLRNSAPILWVLFSKMDLETLKSSRRVCYRWYKESMFELLKRTKAVLRLDSCSSDETLSISLTMKEQLFSSLEGHIKDLKIENVDAFFSGTYFQTEVVNRISSLSFVFSNQGHGVANATNIALIIHSCYNLNDLHFANIPTSTAADLFREIRLYAENEIVTENIHLPLSEIRCLRFSESIYRRNSYGLYLLSWLRSMPKLKRVELNIELQYFEEGRHMTSNFIRILSKAQVLGYVEVEELKFQKWSFDHLFTWSNFIELISLYKLKIVEIGYIEEWKSQKQKPSQTGSWLCFEDALLSLLWRIQGTLEIFRLSSQFNPSTTPKPCLPFPRMRQLKILEIDWDGFQSIRPVFDDIPNWEHLKFIYPKCNYRKEDYFNKVELKVKSSENSASNCKDIIRTLECKSPELLIEIISTVLLRKNNELGTVISVDLRKTKHETLVKFLLGIAKTDIEEVSVCVGCNIDSDEENCCASICTPAEYQELEDKSYSYLWFRNNTVELPNGDNNFFQKLRKFELISLGCQKLDVSFLGKVGILQRIKCSPILEDATLKYKLMFQSTEVTKSIGILSESDWLTQLLKRNIEIITKG